MPKFIPIGGFLGAGKTTTMLAVAKALERQGEVVSVITNDQGTDLVDTQLANAARIESVSEVTGGCFCCRFDDLAGVIAGVIDRTHPTVILAEAVGSCTDLQSTVVRPLRALHGDTLTVAPLAAIVDPLRYLAMSRLWSETDEADMAYLYRHQLAEADIIVINKTDLLADQGRSLVSQVQEAFPHATVLPASAATGQGLDQLMLLWSSGPANTAHRAFEIDYDRYGAAEAELAWTNQTFVTVGNESNFAPAAWSDAFLESLEFRAETAGAAIGHVKLRTRTADGPIKASLTGGASPNYDERHSLTSHDAQWTLNARVAMLPSELDEAISGAIASADEACASSTGSRTGDIFKPGFPVPVHRM